MALVSRRRSIRLGLASLLMVALAPVCVARAEERRIPVPKEVIYPGDVIRDGMLTEISIYDVPDFDATVIDNRAALVGKAAKRTLLPGRGVSVYAVANPKAVSNGAQVKLVYREGGLTIVTSAMALEAGAVGDMIKVRNADSGLTIMGTIQSDGSVMIGDS